MTFLSINTALINNSRIDRQPKQPVSAKWAADGNALCTYFEKQENIDVFSDGVLFFLYLSYSLLHDLIST